MVISRSVTHDRKADRFVVTCKHDTGKETSKVYNSSREFERMLQHEAKRLELKADLAGTEKERREILDKLDRHLFSAQVYGFTINSKYALDNDKSMKRSRSEPIEWR